MLDKFALHLKSTGRSPRTAGAYLSDVQQYARWVESVYDQPFVAAMLNPSDLADYQVHCRDRQRVSAATWNRYRASLKAFGQWLGIDAIGATTRAESQKLAPRSLDISQYKRLRLALREAIRIAKTTAGKMWATRNLALFTLLADAGLREGEIVALRVQDVLLGDRKGRVVILDAKGNKDRSVPLDKDSVDILRAWLSMRSDEGGAFFCGKRAEPLSARGIQKVIAAAAVASRVGHVTPHQLRHTAAYRFIRAGGTMPEVAELLGHTSIETTRRYTLPHWQDLEALVEAA